MVKIPPGWHLSAGALPARGAQVLRSPRVPVEAYRKHLSGLLLTGGQAQGIIPGFSTASGSRTSPPAPFSTIFSTGILPPGTYTVQWSVSLSGTIGAPELNNFILNLGPSRFLAGSVNAAAAGTYPQASVTFATPGGLALLLLSGSNSATSGAVYAGTITGSNPPLSLSVGPQGLGNVWYPVQVTLSTTTGLFDTSTAQVYLGAQGIPVTLVGTLYSGNGTVALAIPPMTPGQALITTWTGGTPFDVAAMNVLGTMDALSA